MPVPGSPQTRTGTGLSLASPGCCPGTAGSNPSTRVIAPPFLAWLYWPAMPYTSPASSPDGGLDNTSDDNDSAAWQNARMPLRLLFLADTHVPKRARALPAAVWDAVGRADVVFHAGDWVSEDLLDELQQRAAQLVGVYGNNDGEALR